MSFNSRLVTGAQTKSGNLNTIVAGTVTGGNSVLMSGVDKGTLSGTFTVLADTNTITISALWEVSNDNSTWQKAVQPNNPADVVIATGTAGADAAVTRIISAPDAVYGFRYCRGSVTNGVVTGATIDTYSIAYNYAKPHL